MSNLCPYLCLWKNSIDYVTVFKFAAFHARRLDRLSS
jgi:hypothetical protein